MKKLFLNSNGTWDTTEQDSAIFSFDVPEFPNWDLCPQIIFGSPLWVWSLKPAKIGTTRDILHMVNSKEKKVRASLVKLFKTPAEESDYKWSTKNEPLKKTGYTVGATSRIYPYEALDAENLPDPIHCDPVVEALLWIHGGNNKGEPCNLQRGASTKCNPLLPHKDDNWYTVKGDTVYRITPKGKTSIVGEIPSRDIEAVKSRLMTDPGRNLKNSMLVQYFLRDYRSNMSVTPTYGSLVYHPQFEEMYSSSSWLRTILDEEFSSQEI